jgi:diguanylate cyclase (GGDEF)-like protein
MNGSSEKDVSRINISKVRAHAEELRESIIGLGDNSLRKSYYPELQKRLEELERANEKQRALLEAMPDTLLVIDLQGRVLTFHLREPNLIKPRVEVQARKQHLSELLEPSMANLFLSVATKVEAFRKMEEFCCTLQRGGRNFYYEVRGVMDSENSVLFLIRDMTEQRLMAEKMHALGIRDNLTGLFNRTYFEESLSSFSRRCKGSMGIIVCDIDGLKFINDTFGNSAGDMFLREVAELLSSTVRREDVVARIGGDEFGVLLCHITEKELQRFCHDLERGIGIINLRDSDLHLSVSVGYAFTQTCSGNGHALFLDADNAMYRKKLLHSDSIRNSIVRTLMKALEARDYNTEGHGQRMIALSAFLGRCLGFSDAEIGDIRLLAQFHDIGKVGIPDSILFKPGRLDEEEWSIMKTHSEIGARIAAGIPEIAHVAEYIRGHHERWDGEGYPDGKEGEEIPLPCRVVAVADAYDAMVSDRPYRKALSREEALEELGSHGGKQFDPAIIKVFLQNFPQIETLSEGIG